MKKVLQIIKCIRSGLHSFVMIFHWIKKSSFSFNLPDCKHLSFKNLIVTSFNKHYFRQVENISKIYFKLLIFETIYFHHKCKSKKIHFQKS